MKNRIISSLGSEGQSFFRTHAERRRTRTGQLVYRDGDVITEALFPESCIISVVGGMADGRSVEKTSIGREGHVGPDALGVGTTAYGDHVVQVPGEGYFLGLKYLDQALQRFPELGTAIQLSRKVQMLQLMETAACNSVHSAEQRIVRWLLRAHDRVEGDTFYLTQEAIANLLALRRATVNAVCSDLMQSGAITYNRGTVTVIDRERMRVRACECYERIQVAEQDATASKATI